MITQWMKQLEEELELESLETEVPGIYALPVEGVPLTITNLATGGFSLRANLSPYPRENENKLFLQALEANLFGDATNNAVLGISDDGNQLTLSRFIDYNIEYKEFKEIVEDFANAMVYWRNQAISSPV